MKSAPSTHHLNLPPGPGRAADAPFTRRWLAPALLAAALLTVPGRAAANPVPATGEPLRKVRVESADLAAQLQQQGARLVADYGTFQILAASPNAAAPFAADGRAVWADDLDVIELHSGPLHTTQPAVQALREALPAFTGQRLHLVQFAGPVKPEWHAQLLASGAQIVSYIPNNAYLIYGDAAALGRVQTWAATEAAVQWEGAFRDEYRLHPTALRHAQSGTEDLYAIQLVADPKANATTLAAIDQWKLAAVLKQEAMLNYVNVFVRLPAERLAELAAQPDVISIWGYVLPRKQDERQGQILAGNLNGSLPSGPGYLAWLTGKGFTQAQFTASGFAVDVTDSGVDNGTAAPGHFGLYPLGNTTVASRVAYNRLLGTPHTGSTIAGCDGHGTLNSHIIGGYSTQTGFPFTDAGGFSYGLGMAPYVRVGSSVIFDPDSYTSPSFSSLQSRAYADGARISSNSWGANTAGGYNSDAQSYDSLVRDAQPAGSTVPAAGNQEMVIIFSSGNAGPNAGTLGSPGTGKNIISVGAAENVRSLSTANGGNSAAGNDGCGDPDTRADNANDMSDYSSRGPCADGRIKPDLVAPGTHITGGVAQNASPGGTGSALACFSATGVCALPGGGTAGNANNFFPLGQQFYSTSTGTSHSAPAVAGAAALLRQWFINQSLTVPSPAMTKAFLLNSTRYLTGTYVNDTLPSNVQGLGSLNLGMAFDDAYRVVRDQVAADKFTATGQSRTNFGSIVDPSKPFRVTLAWTDAPGSTTGNAYNNNLDLVVTVGGQTYRGNVFSGASSVTGGTADARNNVESVFLPAGLTGPYTVTITAANIVSDGVPNDADPLDQDFALVLYNAQTVPAPFITTNGATVTAESCQPANGAADPGEFVTLSFQLKNIGTAPTTNLIATLLPGEGVLNPSGPKAYGLLPTGAAAAQSYSFQAVGACAGTLNCVLQLEDGGANLGRVTFALRLGDFGAKSFSNPELVTIPPFGAATPYPSTVNVSGLVGQVTKVTASVFGLNHGYPGDVDLLLIGPAGQNVLLLSSTGGSTDAVDANLTFDDDAPTRVVAPVVSGTFRPTSTGSITLPSPAPARPYGTNLAVFNGTAPNGSWQLFVNDHANGDGGTLTGGWSVSVTTDQGTCCFNSTQTDLRAGVTVTPNPVPWDWDVTYTLQVTNAGPAVATNVVITDSLPAGVVFGSATPSQGTASHSGGVVTAALGNLLPGATAALQIVGNVGYGTSLTNVAVVSSETFDFDPAGNTLVTVSAATPAVLNISNRFYLVAESCPSGALDPGENVTVALVLQNVGTRKTTNVVATLLPTGGVAAPSGPQNYGTLAPGGPPVTNTFSFTVNAACGAEVLSSFAVTDNAAPLLVASNRFAVGQPVVVLAEDFDGVTAPALPAGWTAVLSGTGPTWVTTASNADTPPNAVFVNDPSTTSDRQLISPAFTVTTVGAQVSFRHSYNTELSYDGGRLELSINSGAFVDVVTAGGSFVTGGYGVGNMWSGNSSGYITTVANLPASTLNQSVRLRWHFTSDSSVAGTGWYVDTIRVQAGAQCCLQNDLALAGAGSASSIALGETVTYTLGITNSGPAAAAGVVLTNYLPANVLLVGVDASQGAWSLGDGIVVADLGTLSGGAGAGLTITVKPSLVGWVTNRATISRVGPDGFAGNNAVTMIARVVAPTKDFSFLAEQPITIPDSGASSPYPSTITVSGIVGAVSKVTATITGLTHTFPDDLDILLVGPAGQKVMLMSDCGGANALVGVTLGFDDAGPVLPDSAQIFSGTYRPTDFATGETLPAPAPAGPYGTLLAAFNDVDPNGTWSLYVADDASGDSGLISGGWSLTLSAMLPPAPTLTASMAGADLVQLSFDTQAGMTYTPQYKNSLADPVWTDLAPVPGTGAPATVYDSMVGHTQRIYRLRME